MIRWLHKQRRVPRNWPKDVPIPPPTPKHYWDGVGWMSEHHRELVEQYPDQWVAVYKGEVIAAGKDAGEVERLAHEKTGQRDVAMDLVIPGRKVVTFYRIYEGKRL